MDESTFRLLTIIVATIALWIGALRARAALYQMYEQIRTRKILQKAYKMGPFDEAAINGATEYYVKPKCSNIDPGREAELRHALTVVTQDLFEQIDDFLSKDNHKRHLLLLADSGLGKTSFVLNYYAANEKKLANRRHQICMVPLGHPKSDELITSIENKSSSVIFLDAFDEDTRAIKSHKDRLLQLMQLCGEFRKIVITCRTQFFPSDEEIPTKTGVAILAPRSVGEKGMYEFWKLYLMPFNDKQVREYFRKRYRFWERNQRMEAIGTAERIPLLAVRPMLLTHIPDVVNSGREVKYYYELYEIMVMQWLERESHKVDSQKLSSFSESLAVEIYVNRRGRGAESMPLTEMLAFSTSRGIDLERWQIGGRSLLNRDSEGNYKFAHRSIMEFLYVNSLVLGNESACGVPLTDLMIMFIFEIKRAEYISVKKLLNSYPSVTAGYRHQVRGGTYPTGFIEKIANYDLPRKILLQGFGPPVEIDARWKTTQTFEIVSLPPENGDVPENYALLFCDSGIVKAVIESLEFTLSDGTLFANRDLGPKNEIRKTWYKELTNSDTTALREGGYYFLAINFQTLAQFALSTKELESVLEKFWAYRASGAHRSDSIWIEISRELDQCKLVFAV